MDAIESLLSGMKIYEQFLIRKSLGRTCLWDWTLKDALDLVERAHFRPHLEPVADLMRASGLSTKPVAFGKARGSSPWPYGQRLTVRCEP